MQKENLTSQVQAGDQRTDSTVGESHLVDFNGVYASCIIPRRKNTSRDLGMEKVLRISYGVPFILARAHLGYLLSRSNIIPFLFRGSTEQTHSFKN